MAVMWIYVTGTGTDLPAPLCSPAWVKAENYITFLLSCHPWLGFSLK